MENNDSGQKLNTKDPHKIDRIEKVICPSCGKPLQAKIPKTGKDTIACLFCWKRIVIVAESNNMFTVRKSLFQIDDKTLENRT